VAFRSYPYVTVSANQICANPPSTQISLPFTKLESSEARNRALVAISSERPNSLRGMADKKYSLASAAAFARALRDEAKLSDAGLSLYQLAAIDRASEELRTYRFVVLRHGALPAPVTSTP
jgi:hypothetical protein